MVLRTHIWLCVTAGFFEKNRHQAKMTKNGKNGPKTGFLDFYENHVISFVWNLCKTKVLTVH